MWFFGDGGLLAYGLANVRYGFGLGFRLHIDDNGDGIVFRAFAVHRGFDVFELRRFPAFGDVFRTFFGAVWDSHVGSDCFIIYFGHLFAYYLTDNNYIRDSSAFYGHCNLPLILGIFVFHCLYEFI